MRIFISVILSSFFITTMAQFHKKGPLLEVVGGVGITPVFADIGNFGMGPAMTAGFRYRLDDHFALKVNIHSALVFGDDAGTDNEARGLNYMTLVAEPSAQLEYIFFKEKRASNKKGKMTTRPKLRPYIFGGAGSVFYNHQVDGEDMSAVTTDYNKFTLVMVGGAGFLHHFEPHWLWGLELGARFITADYLDGFSPESSKSSDFYNFVTFNLVYRWRYSAARKR